MITLRVAFRQSCQLGSSEMAEAVRAVCTLIPDPSGAVIITSFPRGWQEFAVETQFYRELAPAVLEELQFLPNITRVQLLRYDDYFNTLPIAKCATDGTLRTLTHGDSASPPPRRAIEELVMNLIAPPPRSDGTWFRVGCALRSASPSYLDIFERYSRRSDKISDPARRCAKMWNGAACRTSGPRATWMALKHMASTNESRRRVYLKWCRKYGFLG
jgi:hypothetical protein